MIVSTDFGYGYVKVCDSNYNLFKFPSLVSRARRVRFISETANKDKLSKMWISLDGEDYFVGDLAYTQGTEIIQVLHKDKFLHKSTEVLMKASLGYALLGRKEKQISCITGLPVSYFNPRTKMYLESQLRRQHKISFNWSFVDPENPELDEVVFDVTEAKVIPQPLGTLYHMILDEKGEIKKEMVDFASSVIAVIDIGFGTTDLVVVDNLEYIDKFSRSINTGVSNVCANISTILAEKVREEIPVYEILKALPKKEIIISNKKIDLTKLIDSVVDDIFNEIFTNAKSLWNKKKDIRYYVITGGGQILFFEKFKNTVQEEGIQVIKPGRGDSDSIFANVLGFQKYMVRFSKKN